MNEKYPYLGLNHINDKTYVVFFTEPDHGVVVLNETDSKEINFGMIGNFDESLFEPLPPDQCVRLNN